MTRLTEALERAHLVATPVQGSEPAPEGNEEVLRRCLFDSSADMPMPSAAPTPLPATPTPPRFANGDDDSLLSFSMSDDLAGKLVVGREVDQGLVEEYRRLAAILHNAQTTQRMRSVMIASAVAAEGKTLTATNIALTLSQSFERRVLLIDADLRRPSLDDVFQLPKVFGLNEALTSVPERKVSLVQVSRNLSLLPAGAPDPDPMSTL